MEEFFPLSPSDFFKITEAENAKATVNLIL